MSPNPIANTACIQEPHTPTLPTAFIARDFDKLAVCLGDTRATRYHRTERTGRYVLDELLKMQSTGEQQRPASLTLIDRINHGTL